MKTLDAVVVVFAVLCAVIGHAVAGDRPPAPESPQAAVEAPAPIYIAPLAQEPVEVVAAPQSDWRDLVPLDRELVDKLVNACEIYAVPVCLALAVMERESRFDAAALNPRSGCYGLMQLNPAYFPSDLGPADNIAAGVGYLGKLLAAYDTVAQAVVAYHDGPTTRTQSWYSDAVMARAEAWEEQLRGGDCFAGLQ